MSNPVLSAQIRISPSEQEFQIVLHDATEATALIGEELMAVFMKLFVGVDRLMTFEHFLRLLEKDGDTPADQRNLRVLFYLLAGTMHEIGDTLQELCSLKVVEKMADVAVWEPLNLLRREWYTHPLGSKVRNQAGHHLGEIDTYRAGLIALMKEAELVVYRTNHATRHEGMYEGPQQALWRGMGIDEGEWRAFVAKTRDGHQRLPDLVMAAFKEVLRKAGVEFAALEMRGG